MGEAGGSGQRMYEEKIEKENCRNPECNWGGVGGEKNGILLFKEIENLSKGENRKDDKGSFKTNKNKNSIRRREEI